MGSVVLLSILSFSKGLDLLKEVGVSVIFVLFVLSTTPGLSGGFKLTTSLKSRAPERTSTISVSQKSDISKRDLDFKGSTVNQKVFPFLSVLLKLGYNTQERYFPDSAFSNFKEI